MTWQTLNGKPLVGESLKRLRDEIAARNVEAKARPSAAIDYRLKPLTVSPRLKPFIEKIAAETKAAEEEERSL